MHALSIAKITQGTTSTPSILEVGFTPPLPGPSPAFMRVRVCNSAGFATATNATIAVSGGDTVVETHTSTKDLTLRSSTPVKATGTLTISGVVLDTETATIGTRVYEFDSSTASNITSGRVRVDISASATKSQGTLRLDTIPTANDLMVIGGHSYVFVASGTGDTAGEISIGANLAAAETNILAALAGTDGFNTAHPTVTAAAGTNTPATVTLTSDATAPSNGDTVTIGNKVYTFQTSLTNVDGNVLIGASAAAALDNLKAAVNLSAGAGTTYATATTAHTQVTATTNTDTTQVFSATVLAATAGNATTANLLTSTETSSHLAFGTATFLGALDKIVLTAVVGGTGGDSIATTETFTATNNTFDAGTLGTTTAGVSCSAANATIALAAAINADASAVASATSTTTTVALTASRYGTASNSYATTETMANGSFGAVTLTGGSDSGNNKFRVAVTDATAETYTVRFGPALVGGFDADWSAPTASINVTHAA